MYSKILIVLFCAIALIEPQIVKSEQEVQLEKVDPPKNAVDIHTSDGLHFIFPYFSSKIQTIDDVDMRESIKNVGVDVLEYLDKLLQEMLNKPSKKISLLRWLGVGKDLYKISTKAPASHRKANDALGASSGFNKYIKDTLVRMITRAKEAEKELIASKAPKDHMKLKQELHTHVQGTIESLKASPVGVYLDWSHGSIDGVQSETKGVEMMGKLRYHGYAGLLNTLEKLMNIVLVFA